MFDLQYDLDLSAQSRWNTNNATAAAKNSLIYLQEVGDFYAGPAYFTSRQNFPSYLLKLTVGGCGVLEYNGQRHRVPPGHFFWIDCAVPQRYYTEKEAGRWHVLWVHFYGANAGTYYEAFLNSNHGSPVAAAPLDFSIYDLLYELLSQDSTDANQLRLDFRASGLLTQLVSQCVLSTMLSQQSDDMPQIVQSVRLYLQNHYTEKNTLQQLGAQFNINPYYLQKQFKRYVGQSPTEFQIYLRINRAKALMRSTRRPIGEIAYEVGIDNLGYFTRLFKQQEGMTPVEYRRLWPVLERRFSDNAE